MKKSTRITIFAAVLAIPVLLVTVKNPPGHRTDLIPPRSEIHEMETYEQDEQEAADEPEDTQSPEDTGPPEDGTTEPPEQIEEEPEETQPVEPEETHPVEPEETHLSEPEETQLLVPQLFELNPGEAVVYSYSELKNALEQNNGITTVFFGGDITMQLGGVRINPNKRSVTVSGLNPLEAEQSVPYTLTDYSSASFYNTIYIDAAGTNTLHVRDMNIVGKNYYGPVSILDSSQLADVLVTFERVTYDGPQMCYHRQGTVWVSDCTARIHGGNGGSLNQEFSEVKHLIFKGLNKITSESSANTVFWHPLGGSFAVADDSALSVTSPNTSALYGIYYADSYVNKVSITVGERAALEMTVSGVVAPEVYVTLGELTVREGGRFYLKTTKAASNTVLRIGGALTVEKEAGFIVSGYGGSSVSLLRQAGGDITVMPDGVFRLTAAEAYSELINLVGRSFICDNPASVLLYNEKRDIAASANPGNISINAQQVNHWNAVNPGGLDAPESSKWYKPDGANFTVSAVLGTGGEITGISSNYTQGDPPGSAPDAVNFSMAGARILAFGRLEVMLARPAAHSEYISGVTRPGAVVRISFTQEGAEHILPDVTADSAGVFHIPTGVDLREGTVITALCSWQYLTASDRAVVAGAGGLEFFVPETMEFFISGISPKTQTIRRLHPGWEIAVSDSRGAGGGWRVFARLGREMTPDRADLPALTGVLIYADDSGGWTELSVDRDILIASHATQSDGEVYPVSWPEDGGVLLRVEPGTAYTGTVYTGEIVWTLIDGP